MAIVKVVPLGGVGEIGKNCTVVEQGEDLIVLDAGLSFPTEEMPGVDIVIPDFSYLAKQKDRVRGIFITHAHEDHVGALAYLLRDCPAPVYASEFTIALVRDRVEERARRSGIDFRPFQYGEVIQAGSLSVEPVRVTHSIPGNAALAVHTEHGVVLLTGDFKLDFTPVDGKLTNIARLAELGKEGVVLLLSDCTNVERPGWSPSERTVSEGLRSVLRESEGRVLLTTFASNIHRMQQLYDVAAETGRKVAVVGRRMEQNVEVCSRLGYLQIPPSVRIALDEIDRHSPRELAVLTTGSQGEPLSALVQMSKGEYGRFQVRQGDTVVYSARPIPGNEAAIWRTVNRLFRMGARVVYEASPPVHVSGHGYREELQMAINLMRPFYLAPVHGEARHQHQYLAMAREMGYPEHRLFTLEDGDSLCLDHEHAWLGEKVPCGRILVDSGGAPGVTDDVLRDRRNLASEGMVAVTVVIDPEVGDLAGEPILQSRGLHGVGDLQDVRDALMDELARLAPDELRDTDKLRHEVADSVRRFIQRAYQKRPLVLPTIVEA